MRVLIVEDNREIRETLVKVFEEEGYAVDASHSAVTTHFPEIDGVRLNDVEKLEICDTGPGISAGHLPHLFDRFYRIDESRETREGHTGLGLSICKSIVEAHEGRITVESREGEGAQFIVILPIHSLKFLRPKTRSEID